MSAIVVFLAVAVWSLIWNRLHPAASPASRVNRGTAENRIAAIRQLSELGGTDPNLAIPALALCLSDSEPAVRAESAGALTLATIAGSTVESADEEIRKAVKALMGASRDERAEVRVAVATALGSIATSAASMASVLDRPSIYDLLLEMAGDADAEVRHAALRGVGAIGIWVVEVPPPVLLAALEDASEQNRAAAAIALVHFRRGLHRCVPTILQSLSSTRPDRRNRYLEVLGAIRSPQYPPEAQPALLAMLDSAEPEVRALAASALATFKEIVPEAIPALIRCLGDVRHRSGTDEPEPTSEELMILALDSESSTNSRMPTTREPVLESARTLGHFGPTSARARDVIAALSKTLGEGRPPQRVAAANALGRFPTGLPVRSEQKPPLDALADPVQIASLTKALDDRFTIVRIAALRAFHDVGMRVRYDVTPVLDAAMARALEDASADCRMQAAAAIAHYGGIADCFFPALIQHAEHDPDEDVKATCCAVISLGSQPLPARVTTAIIPLLIKSLSSPEAQLRQSVCILLGRFGPGAAEAVPGLIALMRRQPERNGSVSMSYRGEAAISLGKIAPNTPRAREACSALIEATRELRGRPDEEGVSGIVEAIGMFGPAAADAEPYLRELVKVAKPWLGERAANSLAAIAR